MRHTFYFVFYLLNLQGMLPSEQEIAVKTFTNGRYSEVEFNNEVMLLANLQHRNMVKILGFWVGKNSRLIVYEYLPNGSLEWFLCGKVYVYNFND